MAIRATEHQARALARAWANGGVSIPVHLDGKPKGSSALVSALNNGWLTNTGVIEPLPNPDYRSVSYRVNRSGLAALTAFFRNL